MSIIDKLHIKFSENGHVDFQTIDDVVTEKFESFILKHSQTEQSRPIVCPNCDSYLEEDVDVCLVCGTRL